MCVPALLDLGAGLRCCSVRSIWTSAVKPHGVLHTSSCRLHKKAEVFFPVLMYPRLGRAKNGVFSTVGPNGPITNDKTTRLQQCCRSSQSRNSVTTPSTHR